MTEPSAPIDRPEPAPPPEAAAPAPAAAPRRSWRRAYFGSLIAVVVLLALYYLGGMIWLHRIDDDLSFGTNLDVPAGASRSVALAAALIDREVNQHRWVANDPFFMPGSLLDNMPNFQQGVIAALSRFAIELTDHIGRTRGSSQADPDLDAAAGFLRYPGDVWVWNPSTSLAPTASSERQYRQAIEELRAYNDRLARQQATFEVRADNLLSTFDRFTSDLGSASATLYQRVNEHGGWLPDFTADDIFYRNKGRLYAYYMLLRELETDFAKVIEERDLAGPWRQTVESLRDAATLQPWVVTNGPPDGQMLPSHLAVQGFYLLRARTQLKEITDILQK
jgi:hypothetical protein